jgi:hypothetical protein
LPGAARRSYQLRLSAAAGEASAAVPVSFCLVRFFHLIFILVRSVAGGVGFRLFSSWLSSAASLHRPNAILGPQSLDLCTHSRDLLSACVSVPRPQDVAPGPGPGPE